MQRIFLSPYRLEDFSPNRLEDFSLHRLENFLSIDSRIFCLEPLENELSLLVKGEAVRLENLRGEEWLEILDADLAGSVTEEKSAGFVLNTSI